MKLNSPVSFQHLKRWSFHCRAYFHRVNSGNNHKKTEAIDFFRSAKILKRKKRCNTLFRKQVNFCKMIRTYQMATILCPILMYDDAVQLTCQDNKTPHNMLDKPTNYIFIPAVRPLMRPDFSNPS